MTTGARSNGAGRPLSAVGALPVWPISAVPALSAQQMREVDRIMVEELGLELLQMKENARCGWPAGLG